MFLFLVNKTKHSADANLLLPFSLQGANASPSGDLVKFIKYCCDMYFYNHAENVFEDPTNANNVLDMPPLAVAALTDFVETKIHRRKRRWSLAGNRRPTWMH